MRQNSSAGLCRGHIRAAGQTVPRGGRFQRAEPAGPGCAGAACGPPLPLRKLRLYAKYIPYNSIKFILFLTNLPPTAIRRASISCQKSASIGPSSCKRQLAHSSTGFVPGQGIGAQPPPAPPEAPAGTAGVTALRAARAAPRPFSAFIQLVLYRQIILTFDRIPRGFAITNAVYHFWRIKTPRNNSVKENQK